jgi:SAM-dependent methyltransferase
MTVTVNVIQEEREKTIEGYAKMAKAFMNKPMGHPNDVVGNYQWHENYPYENYLLFRPDSSAKSVTEIDGTKIAVDFGCGPGRMINRMKKFFKRVDGIDISDYALDWARRFYPDSNFYVSSGADVGDVPANTYDFVYNTISIQHIPVRTIRQNIYEGLYRCMKDGGAITLQLAYNPTYQAGVWSHDTEHASYESDFFEATRTNGHADVVINEKDLPLFKEDFEKVGFKDVEFRIANVSNLYGNLNGAYHAPYWATDWLFIYGRK